MMLFSRQLASRSCKKFCNLLSAKQADTEKIIEFAA
jgi:hypothetical protein